MSTRRIGLERLKPRATTHAGLWLDKYITEQQRQDTASRGALVEEVAAIREPPDYADSFGRWKAALTAFGAVFREATVEGRLAVGLGNESVLETSIMLHRTYGVPVIPGSALKGLAAAFCRQQLAEESWGVASPAYRTLFGDTAQAGYITVFDALYLPRSGYRGQALYPDVITVHHPNYYQKGDVPPAEWDNPTPIPFLSATGRYLLALSGPAEWVNVMFNILEPALAEMGVGAKTSSGYGRLRLAADGSTVSPVSGRQGESAPADPDQAQIENFLLQLEALPLNQVAPQISQFVERWRNLEVGAAAKQQLAQAILDKVRSAGRESKSAGRRWFEEIKAASEG